MRHEEINTLQLRLERIDRQIVRIRADIDQAPSGEQGSMKTELDQLVKKRRTAGEQLARARLAAAESWQEEDFRAALFATFDDIGRRIDRMIGRH